MRHEIVHNRHIMKSLKAKGARFVEDLDEVPEGAVTIFSAHGVPRKVENEAQLRSLPTIDATCPLVTKVHIQGRRYIAQGRIGVLSAMPDTLRSKGRWDRSMANCILWETKRTWRSFLSPPTRRSPTHSDDLERRRHPRRDRRLASRFSDVAGPEIRDICYATQNRQSAVRELSRVADVLIVVGARNSSNSNRLQEIGEEAGFPSYLVADSGEIDAEWVRNTAVVGVTAGASAPETSSRTWFRP